MWKILNNLSWILNIILCVLIILLIYNRDTKDYSNLNREDITKIVDRYIDTSENEHVVSTPVVVNSGEFSSIKHTNTYKLIDSLSRELKIANNKINGISTVSIVSNTVSKGELVDTVYKYKDDIISWTFNPKLSILDYNANLKINSVIYSDSKKFLGIPYGPKTIYNDIWVVDPKRRFKINGVDNIIIKHTEPDSRLKISGIAEYRVRDNNLLIGPEVQFNYNRTAGYFNYLYSPQYGTWEPTIGIKYYFLK